MAKAEMITKTKATAQKVMKSSLVQEFQEFIARGNVVDLAVGVIIGGAFGKIVTSLVNDILMPILGVILNGIDFSGLMLEIGEAQIHYGLFLQNVVDFVIMAVCIFLIVKAINKFTRGQEVKKEKTAKKTPTVEEKQLAILEEIRDNIAKK